MIGENLKSVVNKYPRVFADIHTDVMSEIPTGWTALVEELCSRLDSNFNEHDPNQTTVFDVMQIKEKFGSLRFYHHIETTNDSLYWRIKSLIHECEVKSQFTCQYTGKPGELCMKDKWLMVLCEEKRLEFGATKARKELNSL